jgi:hypothetical protein
MVLSVVRLCLRILVRSEIGSSLKLLARKQQLLDRLQENPGPNERDEIERVLAQIDTALDLLDEAGPGETSDEK